MLTTDPAQRAALIRAKMDEDDAEDVRLALARLAAMPHAVTQIGDSLDGEKLDYDLALAWATNLDVNLAQTIHHLRRLATSTAVRSALGRAMDNPKPLL